MTKTVLGMVLILVVSSGCATGPDMVAQPRNLEGDRVIFFEQSDRIPKEVLLAAHEDKGAAVNAMVAIPPEVWGALLEEILKVVPEITEHLSKERMENSLIQRRILLRGYSGEELKDVIEIIKAFNGSIEFITPQDQTPTVRALEQPKK